MNSGSNAVTRRSQPRIPVPNGPVPNRKTSPSPRANPPLEETPTSESQPSRNPRLHGKCSTNATAEPPTPTNRIRPLPTNWPATQPPTANAIETPATTTITEGSIMAPSATNNPTESVRCSNGRDRTPGPAWSPMVPKGAKPLAEASCETTHGSNA